MKEGDIFYSVMQKDNCPFEKPRITKFVVKTIYNENCSHPIVSTKTDKWNRPYCFKEEQIYLTYKEALVEKQKIQEKIKAWEKEVEEMKKNIFENKKDKRKKNSRNTITKFEQKKERRSWKR